MLFTHLLPIVTSYIIIVQYQDQEIDMGTMLARRQTLFVFCMDVCGRSRGEFYTILSHVEIHVTTTTIKI